MLQKRLKTTGELIKPPPKTTPRKRKIKSRIVKDVNVCLEYYLEVYAVDQNLKSQDTILRNILHLSKIIGEVKLLDITEDTITRYKTRRRKQGAAENTIRRELGILQAALNKSIGHVIKLSSEKRAIRKLKIQKPKYQKRLFIPLESEMEQILKHLEPYPNIRDIIYFLSRSAYRRSEALSLQFVDIDFNVKRKEMRLDESKNGYGRTTPLYPELFDFLQEKKTEAVKLFGRTNVNDIYLFRERDNITPLRKDNIYHYWRKAQVSAGIVLNGKHKYRPHDLRKFGIKYIKWHCHLSRDIIMECYSGHRDANIFEYVYNLRSADDHVYYKREVDALYNDKNTNTDTLEKIKDLPEDKLELILKLVK